MVAVARAPAASRMMTPAGLAASPSTPAAPGEVRYREIAVKDLAKRIEPTEVVSARFRAQRIDDFYTAWSAAAGDFNHDGVMDVTAGNKIYFGPNFTESREIYLAQMFNPAKDFTPAMVNFAFDYTGDGWDDVLVVESRPTVLYVNPKGVSRRWDRHVISPAVTSENIVFRDIDNDKKPEVISVGGGALQYIKPDPANPTGTWTSTSCPNRARGACTGLGPATSTATAVWISDCRLGGGSSLPLSRRPRHGPTIRRRSVALEAAPRSSRSTSTATS